MDISLVQLLNLAKHENKWRECGIDTIAVMEKMFDQSYKMHYLSRAELEPIHPQLFNALHNQLKDNVTTYGSAVDTIGDSVLDTINLYTAGTMTFVDEKGKTLLIEKIKTLLVFEGIDKTPTRILFSCRAYNTSVAPENALETGAYVQSTEDQRVFLSLADLTRRYPDWAHQWRMGSELGLQDEELVKLLFSAEHVPVSNVALPDIKFD